MPDFIRAPIAYTQLDFFTELRLNAHNLNLRMEEEMRLSKRFSLGLALSLSALLLGACGGGGGDETLSATSTVRPTASVASPTTTVQVGTPVVSPTRTAPVTGTVLDRATHSVPEIENVRYGGTYKISTSYALAGLDPKIQTGSPLIYFLHWGSEKLVAWVPNDNDEYSHFEPWLAEKWSASTDLKTYTFNLRQGIKWHKQAPVNGRELVADDVVFSLKRYQEKDSVLASTYSQIEAIEAPDKYTVVIKLKEPNAWLFNDIFGGHEVIVPPELVQQGAGIIPATNIGTGPYMMTKYQFRQGTSFVRNPEYWRKDAKGNRLPYVDAIEITVIVDRATTQAAFRTGQLDTAEGVGTNQIIELGNSMKNARLFLGGNPGSDAISFNTKKAPWNDVRVRRAFALALDKDKAVAALTVAGTWRIDGPFPYFFVSDEPVTWDSFGEYYKFDPARAKQLLTEAGYTGGKFKAPGQLEFGASPRYLPLAQVTQQLWKEQGIEIDLKILDTAAYYTSWFLRSYSDMSMNHWLIGDYSIMAFAKTKFDPNSSYNQSFIDDPQVNAKLKELRVTTDAAKQKEIAKFLWDFETSNVYGVWLGGEQGYAMVGENVRNFITRTGKNFTGFLEYPWLATAPRTTF